MTEITQAWEALKDNLPKAHVEVAELLYDVCDTMADRIEADADRLAQLEADNAALMEVVRQFADPHNWNANRNMWVRPDDPVKLAASALPAHLKEAAKEEAR